jgi:integrase
LRKGELLRLTWADVDFGAKSLRILRTKNGEARGVHIPASAAAALQVLKKATVVGASVFLADDGQPIGQGWIEYRWKQVIKDSGVLDFRWHDLRHSCASILAQNGASLPEIGSVLGHQSAAATYRYSHLIDGKIVKGHAALDAKLAGK